MIDRECGYWLCLWYSWHDLELVPSNLDMKCSDDDYDVDDYDDEVGDDDDA